MSKDEIKESIEKTILKSMDFYGDQMMWPYTGTDGKKYVACIYRRDLLNIIRYPIGEDLKEPV